MRISKRENVAGFPFRKAKTASVGRRAQEKGAVSFSFSLTIFFQPSLLPGISCPPCEGARRFVSPARAGAGAGGGLPDPDKAPYRRIWLSASAQSPGIRRARAA